MRIRILIHILMKIKVTDKGRGEGGMCSVSFPI